MARLGAGTRKRADGTLEKRFTIDGKRYSVYGKNAKEISQKEQEIRKKIEAGIYTDNRNITLDQYFDEWLKGKRSGTNPAEGVKALKEKKKATETYHRALTEQEQQDFMGEMANDYYYEFVSLLLCTGMRVGEAAALTWNDIDYKQNVLHVTKTVTFNEDNTINVGSPKSEAGKRDIPLNDTIKKVLSDQRKKLGSVLPMKDSRIFVSVYGSIVHNHAVNRAISGALDRLGKQGKPIEHFTAHALRDTFATRYIEQGGSPQTLKTILGHSSLAMTMDLYSHVLSNTKQKEMDNLRIVL